MSRVSVKNIVLGVGVLLTLTVFPSSGASAATGDLGNESHGHGALPAMTGGNGYKWLGSNRPANSEHYGTKTFDVCYGGYDMVATRAGDELENVATSCYEDGLIDGDEFWHGEVAKSLAYGQKNFQCDHFAPANAVAIRAADRIDGIAFGCIDYVEGSTDDEKAGLARTTLENEIHGGDGGKLYGIACRNDDEVIVQMMLYYDDSDIRGIGEIRCDKPDLTR